MLELINKWRVLALVLLMLVVNSFEIVGLSLFVPIIDLFQNNGARPTGITKYFLGAVSAFGLPPTLPVFLVLLTAIFFVKGFLTMWMRYLNVSMASDLQHDLRCRLFRAFMGSSVAFIHGQRQGALLSVLGEHTVQTGRTFFLFVQIMVEWATVLVYAAFVLFISWQLSLAAFLLGLTTFPLIRWIGRRAHHFGQRFTFALEAAQHTALEALQAKKLVNAMNWARHLARLYQERSAAVKESWQWSAFWSNSPSIILQPLSVLILSVVIWLSLRYALSIALLGAFIMAFIRLLPTVQSAVTLGAGLRAALPSVNRVQEMLEQALEHQENSGARSFNALQSGIRLASVSYHYDSDQSVLSGLNLDIPTGATVALVGPSGSGKTTIADLIVGLLTPTAGKVLVDGVDLNELDLRQYRSRIAYVPQEAVFFNDTIYNNLALGLADMPDKAAVRSVCEQVGAWEFISERKDGLDTVIGDRGVQLSGGQRQRLALARALLRKPELLILDEATSALDHESEQWINLALQNMRENKSVTVIIIAHRFTTIQHADCIYQLVHGRATRLGSWNQAKGGLLTARQELELT